MGQGEHRRDGQPARDHRGQHGRPLQLLEVVSGGQGARLGQFGNVPRRTPPRWRSESSSALTRVLGEPCRSAVSRPCPWRPTPPRRTGLASLSVASCQCLADLGSAGTGRRIPAPPWFARGGLPVHPEAGPTPELDVVGEALLDELLLYLFPETRPISSHHFGAIGVWP